MSSFARGAAPVVRPLGPSVTTLVSLAVTVLCGTPAIPEPEPRTVVANGYTFTYVEQGHGEPVVLVHGALLMRVR